MIRSLTNTEGQFILRISAIEALCDQSDVGAEYQVVIRSFKEHLSSLSIEDDSTRTTVKQWLENASRKSIRQSYMAKIRRLLSEDDARAFDTLYRQRGELVHDGLGRGKLLNAASQALDLGVKLFEDCGWFIDTTSRRRGLVAGVTPDHFGPALDRRGAGDTLGFLGPTSRSITAS
jgi:hypothetical protein